MSPDLVRVEVGSELIHEAKAIADVNQRARVLEVLLEQVLFHLLGVVVVVVAAHTLDFTQLRELDGSLMRNGRDQRRNKQEHNGNTCKYLKMTLESSVKLTKEPK